MKGWCIIPNTGSPKRISPISVPQAAMPEMKDLVPSIGSRTQTYSASNCVLGAALLAEDAVRWEMFADQAAHGVFRRAVGDRHRVEAAGELVLDRKRRAEERQDGVAGDAGELVDEAGEIDGRHYVRLASSVVRLRPIG